MLYFFLGIVVYLIGHGVDEILFPEIIEKKQAFFLVHGWIWTAVGAFVGWCVQKAVVKQRAKRREKL